MYSIQQYNIILDSLIGYLIKREQQISRLKSILLESKDNNTLQILEHDYYKILEASITKIVDLSPYNAEEYIDIASQYIHSQLEALFLQYPFGNNCETLMFDKITLSQQSQDLLNIFQEKFKA